MFRLWTGKLTTNLESAYDLSHATWHATDCVNSELQPAACFGERPSPRETVKVGTQGAASSLARSYSTLECLGEVTSQPGREANSTLWRADQHSQLKACMTCSAAGSHLQPTHCGCACFSACHYGRGTLFGPEPLHIHQQQECTPPVTPVLSRNFSRLDGCCCRSVAKDSIGSVSGRCQVSNPRPEEAKAAYGNYGVANPQSMTFGPASVSYGC